MHSSEYLWRLTIPHFMNMKATVLALIGTVGSVFAQNADIAVTLTSPAQNQNVGPGAPFQFNGTVVNTGTVAISAQDTIVYAPLLNGQLLTLGGQPVVYFQVTAVAPGANTTFTHNVGGLNAGSTPGQLEWCAFGLVIGPNWNNVVESDTLNNTSCADINYNPSIGTPEDFIGVPAVMNLSYYSVGTLYIEVANVVENSAMVSVIDLSGRLVAEFPVQRTEQTFRAEHSLELPKGIYLVNVASKTKNYGSKKISVQ